MQSDRARHKFHHRNGTEFDLLPYGGVERADRTLAWPPGEHQRMNALGFAEVASTTVAFLLPGAVRVQVVALHSLALLKLVAWSDRRLQKDAHDLFVIAKHYLDAGQTDRLYETAMDIVTRDDFDYEEAGAELLGRDLAALDHGDRALRGFVIELLRHETDARGARLLVSQMTRAARDEGLALRLLFGILRGTESGAAGP